MLTRGSRRLHPEREAPGEINAWTTPLIKTALVLIALLGNSGFNERILPGGGDSNLQQYVVVAMWQVIAGTCYFRRSILSLDLMTAGVQVTLLFYAWAVVSALWSNDPAASLGKALALAVTTTGAFHLIRKMTLDDIIECEIHGLFVLNAVSILLALLAPDIGVESGYQHAGQWNGIFVNKQQLGLISGQLIFLSAYRLMGPLRRPYHAVAAFAALICAIGAGSRGGAAFAALSVLCLYLAIRSVGFIRIAAFAPVAMSFLAIVLIAYMTYTGNPAFEILGEKIDFTERTLIWQHALAHFENAPWFGYGLNGFWTLKEVKDVFLERHGWFLDNFHDGYIAILIETGVVGLSIFVVSYFCFALRLLANIRRDGGLDHQVVFGLIFTCLLFFIDFTETFFLRSTNFTTTLLSMCVLVAYAPRPLLHGELLAGAAALSERTGCGRRRPRRRNRLGSWQDRDSGCF